MSTFDWSLAGPFLIVAALVAALITPSIVRDVREARRARTRTLPPVTCSHDYRATHTCHSRPSESRCCECDEHAAAIRNRKPYDQERSVS